MSFTHLYVEHNYRYKETPGVTSMGDEQNFGESAGRLSRVVGVYDHQPVCVGTSASDRPICYLYILFDKVRSFSLIRLFSGYLKTTISWCIQKDFIDYAACEYISYVNLLFV